ncbi:MAG: molybdenum cofactor guanylyltransferase [Gemmatimonadaceae bacterium]|nr:molybdenum cofactor guanylyltransferase [Gemmatimonadaceae bacterium]
MTGAILAGGRASRLGGRAKGLEVVSGRRMVDRVHDALREVTASVVLAGGSEALAAALGLALVADEPPGSGPLGGIAGALAATGGDVLVVAWDMPWVTADVLRPLLATPDGGPGAAWRVAGRIEPLCALYRRSALAPLRARLRAGERRAREVAESIGLAVLDGSALDPRVFASVNTAEELAVARGQAPATIDTH